MMLRLLLAAAADVALAGCDDNTRRYALDATPTESSVKVRARVGSVLVRGVTADLCGGRRDRVSGRKRSH